ncbi:MAG TPA: endonuclease domain-containing protein [Micavibrio sp.]
MKELARKLRVNSTEAENLMWSKLRNRQFMGLKFRRQVQMEGYVVDFFCLERGLIIELDGGQHVENAEYDRRRSDVLESKGFLVKRYWNNEFLGNMEGVLLDLMETLNALTPTLSPRERESFGELDEFGA